MGGVNPESIDETLYSVVMALIYMGIISRVLENWPMPFLKIVIAVLMWETCNDVFN